VLDQTCGEPMIRLSICLRLIVARVTSMESTPFAEWRKRSLP
jgi:hypothetical protein